MNPFFSAGRGGKFLSLPFRGRRPLTVLRYPELLLALDVVG
jgi:hypothetical protein